MKFLDLNGLTYFWSKIKDWSNSNFFSNEGGEISPKKGLHYIINGEQLDVSKTGNENESISIFNVDENGISAKRIVMTEGTATQVLMADGSVKTLNANNGIAGLDSNGNVPLAQLGNLDTTVAEVVTALPTTNIKKHIYLIKDTSGVTQNQYEEYIYTGDTSAAYDASKWEKLGDFRATVDLADYYTKSQVDSIANGKSSTSHTHSVIINGVTKTIAASGGTAVNLGTYLTSHQSLAEYAKKSETVDFSTITLDRESLVEAPQIQQQIIKFENFNGDTKKIVIKDAESSMAGFMSVRDKNKLDWFDDSNVRNIRTLNLGMLLTAQSPIPIMVTYYEDKLVYTISALKTDLSPSFTIPAAGERAGLMSSDDKTKLNGIADGATADSAITTAEIDALFT